MCAKNRRPVAESIIAPSVNFRTIAPFFDLRCGPEHSNRNTTKNTTLTLQIRKKQSIHKFPRHTYANARFGQFIGAACA
jgi:hypothetical protein